MFENKYYKIGEHKLSFYPLVDLLIEAKKCDGWGIF